MNENAPTIASLIATITKKLDGHFAFPEEHAWWILEAITHKKKSDLMARTTLALTQEQQLKIDAWLCALIDNHTPLQYLIGSVPFGDLTILVEPPTLIPRPETEEWCLTLGDQLSLLRNQQLSILDLCTGSGCIALSLAHQLPKATIFATDISNTALALARNNGIHNKISNVTFLHSDLFSTIPPEFTFDCIVANPPYIAPSEWSTLAPSVALWEDKNALIALDNGMDIVQKIIAQAPRYLRHNEEMKQQGIPQVIIEIGHKQGADAAAYMKKHNYLTTHIQQDLAHKDRIVCGRIS